MLNTASLSLEQAPPVSIPFRFFLTAPLFGVLAAFLMMMVGPDLFQSRWSPATLGLTHLITLGFLSMVMCGAMIQMLPVMAGSPVPMARPAGMLIHLLISLGSLVLVTAFLTGDAFWMHPALALLGAGFLLFLIVVGIALVRVKVPTMTVVGMRLAVFALLITVLFGLLLGSGYIGLFGIGRLPMLADAHLGWGILGWIGLLLMAVSFQLVPMFQVTPEYPLEMRRGLPRILFFGLVVWTLLQFGVMSGALYAPFPRIWLLLVTLLFALFSLKTLHLLLQRKRRIPDVTLMFWRLGMFFTLLCLVFWIAGQLHPSVSSSPRYPMLLGIGLLLGVGGSVINGMLYKIVPFLSWFHLQNRQLSLMCMDVSVPNMKELISDVDAKRQLYFFVAALLFLIAAVFQPEWFARPAGLIFLISNLLLMFNMIKAVLLYRATNRALIASQASSL